MASPSEKLAQSLRFLKELQERGVHAIRSNNMTRIHRERLQQNGFIREVMKGWYVPARPDESPGDSTAWYASYWGFCADYLNDRFGDDWCMSAEQSVALKTGNWNVPQQLIIRSSKGGNKPTALLFDTSILDLRLELPNAADIEVIDGLRIMPLPAALVAIPKGHYAARPLDMRAALAMLMDITDLLRRLLDGGHSTVAGRLAGAYRNIGRDDIAQNIVDTMKSAGYTVKETDPFEDKTPTSFVAREISPYVNRVKVMWEAMRPQVIDHFPASPGAVKDQASYLAEIEDKYVTDAYHSLSIEGYRVSEELIKQVASGTWNPDVDEEDRKHADALAARGYWQAFQAVKKSVGKVLGGENPGKVIAQDHGTWYRELFGPSVGAGILAAGDLAGYRNRPVYIKNSMHTPPRHEAVIDLMPAFFELLENESNPAARIVLGHFVFVYIHPYVDGNGRMGRFLMNLMMASGGYSWTVIPVDKRASYMSALEAASVDEDIVPFTKFLAELVWQ
jgi:Fic/DOC family protein